MRWINHERIAKIYSFLKGKNHEDKKWNSTRKCAILSFKTMETV